MSTQVSPLLLEVPQPNIGLGTWTFTVPTTGVQYYVRVAVTVPEAVAQGQGAGSGIGLGSGAGGGDALGFNEGGQAQPTPGGVGQGFGAVANLYPQPPSYGSNATAQSTVSSGLSIVVNDNGSPIFTAPTFGPYQSELKFRYPFFSTAGHSITVVLSSSTASDTAPLNGVKSVITIGQGQAN